MMQEVYLLKHFDLCVLMRQSGSPFTDFKKQLVYLRNHIISRTNFGEDEDESKTNELDQKLKTFLAHAIGRYRKESCKFDQFIQHKSNKEFLDNTFHLPTSLLISPSTVAKRSAGKEENSDPQRLGRKPLSFDQKSLRAKQMESAKIRKENHPGAIMFAASQQSTTVGKLIKKSNSPRGITASLALKAIKSPEQTDTIKKSPMEALAFLLHNNLSKDQYNNMKSACSSSGANIWPNYNKIVAAKKSCRPDGICLQELSAEVPLQNLLNHTVTQLLKNHPVLEQFAKKERVMNLMFYFKFGLDGCGSFHTFMQKNDVGQVPDGSALLVSQLVPLQINLQDQQELIIYRNECPNSPHSCRPIRLSYEHETKENLRAEIVRLQEQAKNLKVFQLSALPEVNIKFQGLLTMVDGKVLQELTSSPAASSCPICHKTYRQIASPQGDFLPKDGSLQFGASILHFGVRAFEAICHIGYRQDIKKSRVQLTMAEKEVVAKREREVKAQFQEKLGLIVDRRRDGGSGNTTTGNVARKAFKYSDITAEICGVPRLLVENIGILWGALSCGFDINTELFDKLCKETKQIYFDPEEGCGWYSLPPTLHKIFEHGPEIIAECPLPIGLTNEEAGESNNKFLRSFRLHHSRKTSWQNGVEDLFHRLMDISDPVIQDSLAARSGRKRVRQSLSPRILDLLKTPAIPEDEPLSSDSDTDFDD